MNVGDVIRIKAFKADGTCYQSWEARVETIDDRSLVAFTPKGTPVVDIWKGNMPFDYDDRATYWFDVPYTFIEGFNEAGDLVEIYMDICSPPRIVGGELHYIDYELDVSREMPNLAFLMDEDEFAEAALKYGYSPEFQAECYRAAHKALEVANAHVAQRSVQ